MSKGNPEMLEHFDKPDGLFAYRLRMAVTMEQDSLDMLRELEMSSHDGAAKTLFSHHADETKHQLENLARVFELLGINQAEAPSPVTKGLSKEGTTLLRKSDESLHDDVALSAALGTEHAEIAAYQTLIAAADAMAATEVVKLLTDNLKQEEHAAEELHEAVKAMAKRLLAT